MTQLFDLSGRTALVTGSARGIAAAGARVVLNGTRADTVSQAVERLASQGLDVQGRAFDVTNEQAVAAAFAQWDKDGIQIDILINNAGIQFRKPLVELELSDWQRVIDTNLTSAFIVAKQAAIRMMGRGTGGKIVNIGSIISESARATVGAYAAAKGGIKMLTRAMSAEWASSNIQANAIGPGYILTDMNKPLVENAAFDAWVKSSNPSQRWGKPEELIGTAVYLASAASSYVNGQIIYVDGGWLAVL
jgi:gluconate 5-dehydrogenase